MKEFRHKVDIAFSLLAASSMILAGCGPTAPSPSCEASAVTQTNSTFAESMEKITGSISGTTREEMWQRLGNLSKSFAGNVDRPNLGQFINDKCENVMFGTQQNGEIKLILSTLHAERVTYPEYDNKPLVLQFDYVRPNTTAKNYLVVYGNEKITSQFNTEQAKQTAQKFLEQYFSDTKPENRVLHLVFASEDSKINFVNVLGNGAPVTPDAKQMGQSKYMVGKLPSGQTVVPEVDIMLSFQPINNNSLKWGISLDKVITHVLSNEKVDVETQRVMNGQRIPETEGSIVSMAAMFDSKLASTILGGEAYKPFVSFLQTQMKNSAAK